MNKQGERLLSMVNDIRGCIVNGRITPMLDDFTSIAAHKGVAVVNYFVTRQCDLATIDKLEVISPMTLVEKKGIQSLIGDNCRIPDHSLVRCVTELSLAVTENLCSNTLGSKSYRRSKVIQKPGDGYMNSAVAEKLLPIMLNNLAEDVKTQQELDECYDRLTSFIIDEAMLSKPKMQR